MVTVSNSDAGDWRLTSCILRHYPFDHVATPAGLLAWGVANRPAALVANPACPRAVVDDALAGRGLWSDPYWARHALTHQRLDDEQIDTLITHGGLWELVTLFYTQTLRERDRARVRRAVEARAAAGTLEERLEVLSSLVGVASSPREREWWDEILASDPERIIVAGVRAVVLRRFDLRRHALSKGPAWVHFEVAGLPGLNEADQWRVLGGHWRRGRGVSDATLAALLANVGDARRPGRIARARLGEAGYGSGTLSRAAGGGHWVQDVRWWPARVNASRAGDERTCRGGCTTESPSGCGGRWCQAAAEVAADARPAARWRAGIEWLAGALAASPEAWDVVLALADDWEGSLVELVDTARAVGVTR